MIDESAHTVFDYGMKDWHDFRTHKCSHCSRQLDIYYCESRLYLVRCKHCEIVSLVEAGNPNEAAEKVSRCAQQPNKPLTKDELRRRNWKPVWVRRMGKDVECMVIGSVEWDTGEYPDFSDYGKTWLAYDHKPEGSENNGSTI
jgi:hypothetical protein